MKVVNDPAENLDLDELVYRYLKRVDDGETPEATLEELARRHPDLAEGLRGSVEALRAAGTG